MQVISYVNIIGLKLLTHDLLTVWGQNMSWIAFAGFEENGREINATSVIKLTWSLTQW